MKNLIICGCFRSGTTILANMLAEHPEIIMTSEMFYYSKEPIAKANIAKKIERLYKVYPDFRPPIPGSLLKDNYKKFLDYFIDRPINLSEYKQKLIELSERHNAKYFGDKLPEYTFELYRIAKKFKDAKFIFCIRDPRDVICSQIRYYHYYMDKFGTTKPHWWTKPTIEASIKMERNWLAHMKEWEKAKKDLNLNGYELRYFRLVENKEDEVKQLANFLEVDENKLLEIFSKRFNPYHYKEWEEKFPDITDKLPPEWIKMARKYLGEDKI